MLRAAGVSARSFAGRDLVAEILAAQRDDGSFAGRVNTTAFAVLAMRAAGLGPRHPRVRAAGRFIGGQPNPDGGFNFAGRGGSSGVDDTGAALQALAAAGRRRTAVAGGAARFLRSAQNRDGGFPLQPGGSSNAQSTSWVVQALVAVGDDPARLRARGSRTPLQYLRALVGSDGAVRYSRTSTQTPVWVTAQAVAALAGEALPLDPVPRRRAARGAGARAASQTGSQASRGAPESASRTSRAGGLRGGRAAGTGRRSGGRKARARSSLVGWTPYASLPELADRAHAAGIVVATFAWPLS
jgi:energy-coupling factor transport system substrate-specific component